MEFKKAVPYDINIRNTVNGGCIVKVGCAEFSFSTPTEMIAALEEYYAAPDTMETQYNTMMKSSSRPQVVGPSDRENRGNMRSLAGGSGRTMASNEDREESRHRDRPEADENSMDNLG